MNDKNVCGLSFWHPSWLQQYATTKSFMGIFGLLGTIQSMSFMYFIVTLTTLEKTFKIPSQTVGIIMSGNEISQILFSLALSYAAGQRNRPKWIAWGMICCSISCFILALPHFIYGPDHQILQLTEEYMQTTNSTIISQYFPTSIQNTNENCQQNDNDGTKNGLIVPLVLMFISQLTLGVGNTMYYSLGQTYLDDNTKHKNTPLMLSFAMSLRMVGPILGFFLGSISLNIFINPELTPIIDKNDQRWLGAWWLGWIVLGSMMFIFSGLIGLFPKQLPTRKLNRYHSELPKVLKNTTILDEEYSLVDMKIHSNIKSTTLDIAKFSGFSKALIRLFKNKLLIFNIFSSIFYILGATSYMTFLTKYIEVQFHKNAQNATILVGPTKILGMIFGLLISGLVITKYKPHSHKVLLWNVFVGMIYIIGNFSYIFLYCERTEILANNNNGFDLITSCNVDYACNNNSYNPVCHLLTDTTYFSPCHAGCKSWNPNQNIYMDCLCVNDDDTLVSSSVFEKQLAGVIEQVGYFRNNSSGEIENELNFDNTLVPGICANGCLPPFYLFVIISFIIQCIGSSGRVGNLLVNFRTVKPEDKSLAQGLTLMLISLLALIPGPIIFGRIIDATCLLWAKNCDNYGNCQIYDQKSFRYSVNGLSIGLTTCGICFDILVWYYGRNMDLYGEKQQQQLEAIKRKNRAISPLLEKKRDAF